MDFASIWVILKLVGLASQRLSSPSLGSLAVLTSLGSALARTTWELRRTAAAEASSLLCAALRRLYATLWNVWTATERRERASIRLSRRADRKACKGRTFMNCLAGVAWRRPNAARGSWAGMRDPRNSDQTLTLCTCIQNECACTTLFLTSSIMLR